MKRKLLQQGKGPLELIEEAVHLLRLAPVSVLSVYYVGSLPFVLGVLYFWADMSRSAWAERRLSAAALGLSLLFCWMKVWQAVFARQALALVKGDPPAWPGWRQWVCLGFRQTVLHSTGLVLLPVAFLLLLPFGWVYAFYQNVSALDEGDQVRVGPLAAQAWRQAGLWPGQNHYGLLALKLFGLFVLFNLMMAAVFLPQILKSLLGVETVFSRSSQAFLNTTFFASMLGLAYLVLDPLLKCFYVLRCFYGRSVETGEDLRSELRRCGVGVLGLLGLILALAPVNASAAPLPEAPAGRSPTVASSSANSVSSEELEQALRAVLREREFQWRLPRDGVVEEKDDNALTAWLKDLSRVVGDWMDRVGEWFKKLRKWLRGDPSHSSSSSSKVDWVSGLQWLLVILTCGLAVLVGVLLVRWWRGRQTVLIQAQPATAAPDVTDEDVSADELPQDQWMSLARDLLARGETRLALRALHLASLAHLAERQLINLARYKSNRDYERELGRRGHALPEVTGLFSENIARFDCCWYGLHEVTSAMLERFTRNVDQIKAQT